jgi:putative hydrolase of the HAD superfamily
MKVPKGILLDLDDTLYPERSYFDSGVRAVANWLGGGDWEDRLRDDISRHGRSGVLDRIPVPRGMSETAWRAALLLTYRNHRPEVAFFDDVVPFMAQCRVHYCKLALVTDGKSAAQWRKLTALGLADMLDAIVCSDDIDSAKPAARPFEAACALIGLQPADCIYLADDASKDFIGPRGLGMDTLQIVRGLPYPLAKSAPGPEAEARRCANSLDEAARLLFGGDRT